MVTHAVRYNDSHPTALAGGISLHQSFPKLKAGSTSEPVQSRLLGRGGLGRDFRADHRAR